MKCPKFHSDNSDTARFCRNCATALTWAKTAPPSLNETLESPVRVGRDLKLLKKNSS